MNETLKFGLIAGIVALGVWGWDLVRKAATQFTVRIVAYGTPTVANWIITIPLVIEVNNPAPLTANVDQVVADLYVMKSGQWTAAAHVDQPLRVPAGLSRQIVTAQVNIVNIFGGNVFATFATFGDAINNRLQIKADVTAIYAGVTLPMQSFTDTVAIR